MDAVHLSVENEVLVRAYSGKSGWKDGSLDGKDAGDEEEEIDFIEVEKGVIVAFDDIKNAKLACANEGWPGFSNSAKEMDEFPCPKRR